MTEEKQHEIIVKKGRVGESIIIDLSDYRAFISFALIAITAWLATAGNEAWREFALMTGMAIAWWFKKDNRSKAVEKIYEETIRPDYRSDVTIDPQLLYPLKDPVTFSKHILFFNPFAYQEKLLTDKSKRICACMGRQTGKSTTISAKAIHFAITNYGTTTLIVSATLRQSMLMFDKILSFIETNLLLKSYIAYRSRTRIKFMNESWVIALPCGITGATLRGHTAHLAILDEAAFIPEEVINNVVLPMLSTTDGSCWMLSTPYDREHVFYKIFNDPSWSIYHLPSGANPLISKEFLEEQRKLIGETNYLQEYEAQFVDDTNAYFPMTLIRPCIDPELPEVYELRQHEESAYAGYDPGGKQDPAALIVVTKNKDGYAVRYAKTWLNQDYTTTDFAVIDICKAMGVEKLFVDQTGLGNPILEHLNDIYQKERVHGVFLTQKRKEEVLLNLKLLFEQKLIRIPNDRGLLANLNCITYERSHTGNYYFKHGQGTHDDLAYSLALAVWTAKENTPGVVIKV